MRKLTICISGLNLGNLDQRVVAVDIYYPASGVPGLGPLLTGQQFAPAQSALVASLALPQPPERKLALGLLIRALLGLNEPDGASLQIASLMQDYPYDAQIHFAIDHVIDAQEAAAARMPQALLEALVNCRTQN